MTESITYDDYLAHYGVKGMKWGRRKNENYSSDQRARDSQIYGNRGVKRINKNMNKGESVSTARSREKTRRDTVTEKAVDIRGRSDTARVQKQFIGGAVGGFAGRAAGAAAVSGIGKAATSRTGQQLITKITGDPIKAAMLTATVQGITRNPDTKNAAMIGGAAVGAIVGSKAPRTASKAYVRSKGYNPNRR